jgi:hypothetical protein
MLHRHISGLLATAALMVVAPAVPAADLGVVLGLGLATQDFDCDGGHEYDTGYMVSPRVGVYAEYELGPRLFLDVELNGALMGMSYEWEIYTVDNFAGYVSLPVTVRAELPTDDSGKAAFYASAGPRADVLVFRSADEWFEPVYDDFTSFGLGADFGLGMLVGTPRWVRWELRYSVSFTDCVPDDSFRDITNRAISVGVAFNISKVRAASAGSGRGRALN